MLYLRVAQLCLLLSLVACHCRRGPAAISDGRPEDTAVAFEVVSTGYLGLDGLNLTLRTCDARDPSAARALLKARRSPDGALASVIDGDPSHLDASSRLVVIWALYEVGGPASLELASWIIRTQRDFDEKTELGEYAAAIFQKALMDPSLRDKAREVSLGLCVDGCATAYVVSLFDRSGVLDMVPGDQLAEHLTYLMENPEFYPARQLANRADLRSGRYEGAPLGPLHAIREFIGRGRALTDRLLQNLTSPSDRVRASSSLCLESIYVINLGDWGYSWTLPMKELHPAADRVRTEIERLRCP